MVTKAMIPLLAVQLLVAVPGWAAEPAGEKTDQTAGSDTSGVAAPASLEDADRQLEQVLEEKPANDKQSPAEKTIVAGQVRQEQQRLRFVSSGLGGEAGLWRVMEAGSSSPWTIRLNIGGGFFLSSGEGGFLNYRGESSYDESYMTGRLAISWTPLPFLEAFASLRSSSNRNSLSRPELLQTQGDLELGAKGFYRVLPYLSLGADLAVQFVNGIGGLDPDFSGTSLRTAALFSFDLRPLVPRVPLRAHLNAGFIVENTGNLEDGRDLTIVEMFALRVNKYHRVRLGFGLDAPLPYLDPVAITPFLEYTVELPIGISSDELASGSLQDDTSYANVVPMRLTPGVRVTYLRDITLDVAVDVGIGGKKAYLEGVPSVPPYTVWFALTYNFDPRKRGEEKIVERIVEKEKIVEKQVPAPVTTGRISGRVLNAVDNSPVAGALLTFEGADIPPVASDEAEGKYETYDLTAGMVKLTARKEGFKSMTQEAEIKAGQVTPLDFLLEPEIKKGTLSGTVAGEKDQPLVASVHVEGPVQLDLTSASATGAFASEVPPGEYQVKVVAKGYLAKARHLKIEADKTVLAEFKLTPKPKRLVVILKKNKIEVRKKIHFASGRAEIRPDSFAILDGVVDILVNNPQIKKIRIEGHTDSMGSNRFNKRLSQQRAEAVQKYLEEQGIEPQRLDAVGYGEERPIAPNNTRRGRAQNRRVEFIIVQQ